MFVWSSISSARDRLAYLQHARVAITPQSTLEAWVLMRVVYRTCARANGKWPETAEAATPYASRPHLYWGPWLPLAFPLRASQPQKAHQAGFVSQPVDTFSSFQSPLKKKVFLQTCQHACKEVQVSSLANPGDKCKQWNESALIRPHATEVSIVNWIKQHG